MSYKLLFLLTMCIYVCFNSEIPSQKCFDAIIPCNPHLVLIVIVTCGAWDVISLCMVNHVVVSCDVGCFYSYVWKAYDIKYIVGTLYGCNMVLLEILYTLRFIGRVAEILFGYK